MIQVDGATLEGGGQLLRMATSYGAILGKPVNIYNVRANRRDPGLRPQHLTTLRTAAELCSADLEGAELGSKEITFKPGDIRGGEYRVDIGTAGSISLLLQCINPILWYADKPTTINIKGGTAVKWSPPTPFLENVVYKAYEAIGVETKLSVIRQGFYPRGGGEITQNTKPIDVLSALRLYEPKIKKITGVSLCGSLPEHVAIRQAASAKKHLNSIRYKANITPIVAEPKTHSPGSFVVLWCEGADVYMGSDALGARGKHSEVVGEEAAKGLVKEVRSGANVDRHTCDHLVLPASLAEGISTFRASEITLHTLTAIRIAKDFTDADITVNGQIGEPGVIKVKGIGYRRG